MAKKNIVIIGGGTSSSWFLRALKNYKDQYNLSVVCSMADDGGSNGRLQRDLGVFALGSLRKSLLSLSEGDDNFNKALSYRFLRGEQAGHVAGNILMAALEKTSGSAEKALEIMRAVLKVNGQVVPVSFDKMALCAELENGQIVEGESNIDIPKHDGNLKIKNIFLKPNPKANKKAIEAIAKADMVVIGPGDLFTTTLPNLLVPQISEGIKKSKAKKIFAVNPVTKFGETNNFSVLDFTRELEKYLGGPADIVIYNAKEFSAEKIASFKKENPQVLGLVKIDPLINSGQAKGKFIGKDILLEDIPMIDFDKLAKIVIEVFD